MKYMKKYTLLFMITAALLFLYSCRRGSNVRVIGKDFITEYGEYISENNRYLINVSESPKGILKYQIQKPDGTPIIQSEKHEVRIGIYHKWRLYWDDVSQTFWILSSDVGNYVWLAENNDIYAPYGLRKYLEENADFRNKVPERVLLFIDK